MCEVQNSEILKNFMVRTICYQQTDIQKTFTRSKSTIETIEKIVKYVQS